MTIIGPIATARDRLQAAIADLENAQRKWSECVSSLHMSEIALRDAQKAMRQAYDRLCETITNT